MAQTYKFGKDGQWATKKGSTLAYSDTNNAFKPLPFSFERNSIATRVNKEGLIEVVGNDIPRIDYTDSTEGALLLENSATNLMPYSEDFSQSNWTKSNSSITSNSVIAPDGTLNADKLVENTSTGSHQVYDAVITASGNFSNSIFVKAAERSKIRINSGSNSFRVDFDLSNGTVISEVGATGNIVSVSNGWYKCDISWNTVTASAQYFLISLLDDFGTQSYQGNGTSGVYIWGAMLEQNSVASSYIPTNGSTVQRAAETCNGSGNSEVFNDSQGVLFANMAANSYGGGYKLISLTDSTSGNSFVSIGMMNNTNQSYKQIRFGGINLFTNFNDPIDQTSFNKIAIKYKSGDSSFYVNGFEIDSSSVTYTPSANMSEFKFSYFQDGDDFYGKTKELGYYDTALTDLELEYMTSYRSLNEMVTELNLNAL